MFDLLFLIVVGSSTAFAALRGGLRELSTIIALAIAGGLAWISAPALIGAFGMTGDIIPTVVIAAILLSIFFVGAHIGLHLGLKQFPIEGRASLADRIGGGIFGFLRGLALIGLAYLGVNYTLGEEQQPEGLQNAATRPIAASVANWFEGFAPQESQLEDILEDTDTDSNADVDGYRRIDRNGMEEIVTTVTTGEDGEIENATDPNVETDDIADILQTEDQ